MEHPKLMVFPLLRWILAQWLLSSSQNYLPSLSRVDDIRGHKDNICASKKAPNKIWCKVFREYIKFLTLTKYQNTQKESSWDSNECSKQQKT
jgi:hypothetical protein